MAFILADKEIRDARQLICDACPFNVKGLCKKCGCFLTTKILYVHSQCPMEKWK